MSRFDAVVTDRNQATMIEATRVVFKNAEVDLCAAVPVGRYRALMLTALEEACMWAVKGIAHETPKGELAPSALRAGFEGGMGTPMGGGPG